MFPPPRPRSGGSAVSHRMRGRAIVFSQVGSRARDFLPLARRVPMVPYRHRRPERR